MYKKLAIGAAAIGLGFGAMTAVAGAHPVGQPGSPSCHGERVSHGNTPHDPAHGVTPAERAAILTFIIQEEDNGFSDFLEELFGSEVSVAEFHQFVKMNCQP